MIHFTVPAIETSWTVTRKDGKSYVIRRKWIKGYYSGFRRKVRSKRSRAYMEWKQHVQRHFEEQTGLRCPIIKLEEPVYVCTVTYYPKPGKKLVDGENVRKSLVDVLAYGSNDFNVGGWHELPRYDKDNPRVEVWIIKDRADMLALLERV